MKKINNQDNIAAMVEDYSALSPDPFPTHHVSLFDPIVMRNIFRKKKTMASLAVLIVLIIVLVVLVYMHKISLSSGVSVIVIDIIVIGVISWTILRPAIRDIVAARRIALD
jgi:hypothetical protein